ncbi:MAG: thermopsin family protease [Thermoplasmata archaeon]
MPGTPTRGPPDLLATGPHRAPQDRTGGIGPLPGSPPPSLARPGSAYSGSEPAPMGIGDLGGPSGGQPSAFTTTSFQGAIDVGNVVAFNASLPDPRSMSLQLNAFLVFDLGVGRYSYWVQDVGILNTFNRAIYFEDNVWNVTSVNLAPGGITGNGTLAGSGSGEYYGFAAPCTLPGACLALPNPAPIVLELSASLGPGGVPTVRFQFDDQGSPETYDTVAFPFATDVSNFQGFDVAPGLGFSGPCPRCFGDVELVAGGPGNGSQTSLDGATSLVLSLDWWNGGNYEPVPNAADHGVATEEGISGAVVERTADAAGEPDATISFGTPGPLGSLWSQTDLSTIEVSVITSFVGGDLLIDGAPVPYAAGFVEAILVPGADDLSVVSGATTYPLGTYYLTAGEVLTLEVGGLPLVFFPTGLPSGTVWSVTANGQFLDGTGNITFGETAGTYAYEIGSTTGFRAVPASGNVSVGGGGVVVPVGWSSTQRSFWSELGAELGPLAPLLILVLVVVVIVAAVVLSVGGKGRRPRPPN